MIMHCRVVVTPDNERATAHDADYLERRADDGVVTGIMAAHLLPIEALIVEAMLADLETPGNRHFHTCYCPFHPASDEGRAFLDAYRWQLRDPLSTDGW